MLFMVISGVLGLPPVFCERAGAAAKEGGILAEGRGPCAVRLRSRLGEKGRERRAETTVPMLVTREGRKDDDSAERARLGASNQRR